MVCSLHLHSPVQRKRRARNRQTKHLQSSPIRPKPTPRHTRQTDSPWHEHEQAGPGLFWATAALERTRTRAAQAHAPSQRFAGSDCDSGRGGVPSDHSNNCPADVEERSESDWNDTTVACADDHPGCNGTEQDFQCRASQWVGRLLRSVRLGQRKLLEWCLTTLGA